MRIYYDDTRKNIVLGTTSRLFASGSLVAQADRGRIAVIYRANNFRELYIRHTQVLREDGTPVGGTLTDVIDYLNGEFIKSPFTTSAVSFPEVGSDPALPIDGAAWILRTLNNDAGTLQGIIGGFPVTTEVADYKYQLSFKSVNEGIKRVELT